MSPLATSYTPELLELVRSTCLYVYSRLGDVSEETVIAGGLVPPLIIPQDPPPEGADRHVGTRDLDIGFSLAVFKGGRYHVIADRLRQAGFEPDVSPQGNRTSQRWRLTDVSGATVDFLIPKTDPDEIGGSIKHLEQDLAAIVTPGLAAAFSDRVRVKLTGKTPLGEIAERDAWVCGPGAYVVLKALAFGLRGENKDAYDLFYVVRNFGSGPAEVATHLVPLLGSQSGADALAILQRDFRDSDSIGPSRVAQFVYGQHEAALQADVVGFIAQLLSHCRG